MPKGEIQKAKTPPDAQTLDRIQTVFGLILKGASEQQLRKAIAEKWPGADAQPLIIAAMKQIEESGQPDPGIILGWAVETTRMIYQKAILAEDYSLALKAVGQLARLAGK